MQNNNKNSIFTKYLEIIEGVTAEVPSLEERGRIIEEIDEQHLQEVGTHLPPYLLEMLGTWFLQEVYSDKRTNKVALEEFPVLTESQLLRRKRKVVHIKEEETLDVLNYHLRNNSSTSRRDEEKTGGKDEL